jgi:hypothetical protein
MLVASGMEAQQQEERAPFVVAKQGYFFVGGEYDDPANPTAMTGQMYVEYQIPARVPPAVGLPSRKPPA